MYLDPIFGFLINFSPAVSVVIFAIFVLVLINIFYKVLINQEDARQLKARTKEINSQMRDAQKAGDTKKTSELLSEMMKENSKLMKMSLKPMIISFIIVIILLPWLSSTYGDVIANVNNGTGSVSLRGTNYTFTTGGNITIDGGVSFRSLSSSGPLACDTAECFIIGGHGYEVSKTDDKLKFTPIVAALPFSVPFIGYNLGWLGWYILVSIPLVIIIRKLLKIYV